jgi:hypothetical protein
MEPLLWILFVIVCASYAFRSDKKSDNNQQTKDDDDNNDDGLMDTICMLGAMDIVSDGELDGNFSDEY